MPSHSSVALQILSTVNYIFMTKVSVLCMFTCKKTVLNYTIFFSQEGEQGPWWCKIWKRNIFVYMYYFCLLMMGKLRKVKFIENISNFLLQYISSYLMQLISIIYNVMAGIRYTGNSHYSTVRYSTACPIDISNHLSFFVVSTCNLHHFNFWFPIFEPDSYFQTA